MTPDRYILLIAVIAFFAVLGVAQRTRNVHLTREIARSESERDHLAEQNRRLICEINSLAQPARIAERADGLSVDLMDPVELTMAPLADRPRMGREGTRARP
jgi:cell division protein FtsL